MKENVYRLAGLEQIKQVVAEEFSISPDEIFLKTRKRKVMDPYYAAFKLMNEYMGLNVRAIMAIGGRHRTCYYYTKRTSNNLFETDKVFRQRVIRIIERVTNE